MANYTRAPQRFFYRGIALLPADALPQGKVAFGQNIRSYQEGVIMPRWGTQRQTSVALGTPDPVHSLFRLNDTSAYATTGGGLTARRFAGVDDTLYTGLITPSVWTAGITGFSGSPMTGVVATPVNSPRPFLYVADTLLQRKVNSSLDIFPFGIETPILPPVAVLDEVQTTFLESIDSGQWVDYGSSTGIAIVSRINTTVDEIVYDVGTTGMASVALVDMQGVVPGTTIDIGASPVTVIVQEVIPPVSSTTIGRILYDSGASGLCTIQPDGSFTVGQIEAPLPDEIRRRYEDLGQPVPPRVTVSRTVDFPVNGLVILNGTETVRILSIAIGPDGSMSFRAETAGTFGIGDTIDGLSCFRAYFPVTRNAGDPADAAAVQNSITPASATVAEVGGIQAPVSGGIRNWGLVGIEASKPDDIIRVGVRVSAFFYLDSVRLLLDVDAGPTAATFTQNYYMYEWRKSDLATAVQAAAGAATGLMADAQAAAVDQGQVDAAYSEQYGQDPSLTREGFAPPGAPGGVFDVTQGPGGRPIVIRRRVVPRTDGFVSAGATSSRQLSLGDDQWVMLQCRVRDLTRIGTDVTRTLSHVSSAAVTTQFLGTTSLITCSFSDAYLTGGYGPDVGATLPPYVYRYRGRSTITGERGNPSPPMRAGVLPHRGRVILTPGDNIVAAQCDVIDWFRYGGALARWQYVGTSENDDSPLVEFLDPMADSEIDGGEVLRTDLFQPWPSFDLPRSGTAVLAGTSLQRVAGDLFDVDWAADSAIIVNGRATTLYRSPTSTTRMEVVDNCGEGAVIEWSMPSPTLLAQALPAIWGGPINNVYFLFACGDPADPGLLHWTHGNDPDATSPDNTLVVTSPSEPLQNGFFFDGQPYVFSTDKLYRIVPDFGGVSSFRAVETACTKGLWGRWAFCIAPEGIYFLAKDGIYLTAAGGEAINVSAEDLAIMFPQDGGDAFVGPGA